MDKKSNVHFLLEKAKHLFVAHNTESDRLCLVENNPVVGVNLQKTVIEVLSSGRGFFELNKNKEEMTSSEKVLEKFQNDFLKISDFINATCFDENEQKARHDHLNK